MRRLLLVGALVAADQALKLAVSSRLPLGSQLVLWGDALALAPGVNPGASLGILAGSPLLLAAVSLGGAAWVLLRQPSQGRTPFFWPACLVAAGALSNGLDRLRLGGVLDVAALGGRLAFNLADVALLAGALLGVAAAWRSRNESDEAAG
ncbi:lipoprotein signal peptidase [Limnochorda pilosa]|uniref:Lipoprotein signal peptidase n=1 Tax=Limnochorda pilosa TaxID=1555112 RepID=A0A0K2SJW8_LIMPI|nr:lipoprotein signal peptidase [Limnochorda pilosa]